MLKISLRACLAGLIVFGGAFAASAQTGQTHNGMSTTEPAINDANGSTIYLHTPDKIPMPSNANPRANAPMYIPMYPTTSPINPATLNCQPTNCNHLSVLPFAADGYVNGGATCAAPDIGLPANGCSLVLGHDHLVGVPHAGDFNVAWHVILVVFTPQGIADGAANGRTLTLQQEASLVAKGDAFEVPTPIVFNCAIVSATVYNNGAKLSFPFP
jgi:hypothetical protein